MTSTLQALIDKARTHVMTVDERREQRISLALGLTNRESTATREDIAAAVDYMEGESATATRLRKAG